MSKPRVYVTQEPTRWDADKQQHVPIFNLMPAAEYGELVVLLKSGTALLNTVPTIRDLRDKLDDFSDADYILPVGDPASMIIAGMLAGDNNHGRVKLLRWDREQKKYIPIQIDLSGRAI